MASSLARWRHKNDNKYFSFVKRKYRITENENNVASAEYWMDEAHIHTSNYVFLSYALNTCRFLNWLCVLQQLLSFSSFQKNRLQLGTYALRNCNAAYLQTCTRDLHGSARSPKLLTCNLPCKKANKTQWQTFLSFSNTRYCTASAINVSTYTRGSPQRQSYRKIFSSLSCCPFVGECHSKHQTFKFRYRRWDGSVHVTVRLCSISGVLRHYYTTEFYYLTCDAK